jgi:putative intracellular protease/amidase
MGVGPIERGRTVVAQSQDGDQAGSKPNRIGIILFDQFETLDVFGPVQMLGRLPDFQLVAITQDGAPATSSQGLATVAHHSFADAPQLDILLVPGGMGTRKEVENPVLLDFLRRQSDGADYVTSVCTGSALLAKAGILDGLRATTNKMGFDWVAGQSDQVAWQPHARWVVDGKFLTSSGVSAGTDMALALVAKLYDRATADKTAREAEYVWNDDPDQDPFAIG